MDKWEKLKELIRQDKEDYGEVADNPNVPQSARDYAGWKVTESTRWFVTMRRLEDEEE